MDGFHNQFFKVVTKQSFRISWLSKKFTIIGWRYSRCNSHRSDSLRNSLASFIFDLIWILHVLKDWGFFVQNSINTNCSCLQKHKYALLMHAVVYLVDWCCSWRWVYCWNHISSVGIQNYARIVIILHQNSEGVFGKSVLVSMETVREFSMEWVIPKYLRNSGLGIEERDGCVIDFTHKDRSILNNCVIWGSKKFHKESRSFWILWILCPWPLFWFLILLS